MDDRVQSTSLEGGLLLENVAVIECGFECVLCLCVDPWREGCVCGKVRLGCHMD